MPKKLQLSNKVFGRLTVIEEAGRKGGAVLWLCHCGCGAKIDALSSALTSGHTQSCGCLQKEAAALTGKKNSKGTPALIHSVFSKYRRKAGIRGIEFSLSEMDFNCLIFSECYYCGSPPSGKHAHHRLEIRYSGLDRVDSSKGYSTDNVVPCCGDCNRAKMALPKDKFFQLVKLIYERHCA